MHPSCDHQRFPGVCSAEQPRFQRCTAGNRQFHLLFFAGGDLKAAQCHEFIESLPQGYETRIGDEGVYLSGGESQRVCVARAILKNAPILVLDEATAFADPENEYKMQQALQHLIQNKTVIIIAHRLSSIISAQQIIVLNEGKLVQHGKHEILSKMEGLYKNMWDAYTDAFRWELNSKKEVKE